MMDATQGLIKLLAILQAQKSRGWIAHNEFDYFTLCPTCGSWFDCRDPTNLIKHKHDVTASIAVASVIQTSTAYAASQCERTMMPNKDDPQSDPHVQDIENDPPPTKGTDQPWNRPGQLSQNPSEPDPPDIDLEKWREANTS